MSRRATDMVILGAAVVIDDEAGPNEWLICRNNVGDAPREVVISPHLEPHARAMSNSERTSQLSLQVQVWALKADLEALKPPEMCEVGFCVSQQKLLEGLLRLQRNLCTYMPPRCDCKYGALGTGEGTGCPETRVAAALIAALTPDEFATLRTKAGLL